ncbi:MAG TPA: PEGA domain-containing protein [Candidatus Saccharimonadales bacterium]|nr:PEGA domain-containing protein [Candidatus Saccharimonadales bacterium]
MDYLDPKKRFRHHVMLYIGYVLIGVAIVIGTIVLLYQAYGFGLGKNGTVIQNGLFFFSSQPNPADIYVNGLKKSVQTNTRLSLPAGIYNVRLEREGYRNWQRTIGLEGGSVQHVDYPLLIPKTLATKKIQTYNAAPGLVTQSPDRRWLLVQQPGTLTGFEVYDLKNPTEPPEPLSLPAGLLTKANGNASLKPVEWAGDNEHVLLEHTYDGKTEFIVVNRPDPAQSVNLNTALSVSPTKLTLQDKKYDKYYLYTAEGGVLQAASLKTKTVQPYLDHVLGYKSYGDDTMLYATDTNVPAGKVQVKLRIGDKTYVIKTFPAGTTYLLDLTKYDGAMYVTAGASGENKVYIYKDPVGQQKKNPDRALVPTQVLRVTAPNYLSFSNSAQFIVIENGTEFAVYDIENELAYHYFSQFKLDAPQEHAHWMDGNRLTYVSGGKLVFFDYDNANRQVMVNAASQYEPVFTPNFKFLYTVAPGTNGQFDLSQTSLLTPKDQ